MPTRRGILINFVKMQVKKIYFKRFIALFIFSVEAIILSGCPVERFLKSTSYESETTATQDTLTMRQVEDLYNKFYNVVVETGKVEPGRSTGPQALQHLPRDAGGEVNWTTAVMKGYLDPRGSLDAPDDEEEPPLNLNVFIEAKVPLMANVVFPHSIHTYWLSCNNCHPKIFIPEAGANPITMDEIFKGQWCGRCHGKVAFPFWPEPNCRRCHMVPKKMSGQRERF